MSVTDRAIEQRLLKRVAALGAGTTCCPSRIARDIGDDDWRDLMPRIRRVAIRLARVERLEIRQRGVAVDPDDFAGPIRIGRPRASDPSSG